MKNEICDALFRPLEGFRVACKKVLTLLGLRDKQSCKRCGADQMLVWSVPDSAWARVPRRYRNRCLCLECYARLVGDVLGLDVMGVVGH